jgi:hypothetical protein
MDNPMNDNSDTAKTGRIRRLNDLTRTQPIIANANWVMTEGIAHLLTGDAKRDTPAAEAALARVTELRRAIAEYSDWSEGSDPYGEHDFGTFELFGQRIFFKVDYYHPDHDTHAPVPDSIELCRRVLTVMLAEEY